MQDARWLILLGIVLASDEERKIVDDKLISAIPSRIQDSFAAIRDKDRAAMERWLDEKVGVKLKQNEKVVDGIKRAVDELVRAHDMRAIGDTVFAASRIDRDQLRGHLEEALRRLDGDPEQ